MKNPSDMAALDKLTTELKQVKPSDTKILNYYDDNETNVLVDNIITAIFDVIIIITMCLCFFSLCSSMSANLFDQTKEIGVLRAIGFSKYKMKKLYFYEAFVLVMASCILGVSIGVVVGYTMVLQQAMFTSMPLAFFFPWS